MVCEGSGFPEGDNAMLLISLPADSTTPCLIQIYDFLYNPDSLLSYSIAVEARGSTSSNAPTFEDDLSLYWRIQLGCGSPDNKMSVLPPPSRLPPRCYSAGRPSARERQGRRRTSGKGGAIRLGCWTSNASFLAVSSGAV